ncbi:GTP pyrophosphokinase family protein [uncultured Lactobacillus sp.]|uniref:GTP pyrophosphokinase n=1 Tax=uncultured Lactobacillus sp. TaxID=153152 RepID=UPI0025DDCB27|nr:GTP pyrophosphokinase family protein [uncultured Lactobacillus sp.]
MKFRSLRQSFLTKGEHSPIEFVVGRVKTVDSIKEKMQRRVISFDVIETDMQDIAGIRIVCQFVDDIYKVVDLIHTRDDMEVIEERDYVKNAKPSGYRSYHMVISYTVYLPNGPKKLLAEIQIRTLAMNFWATVEHTLNYKYQGSYPKDISQRLKSTAETAYKLDEEMSLIKDEVQEAQKVFTKNKGKEK